MQPFVKAQMEDNPKKRQEILEDLLLAHPGLGREEVEAELKKELAVDVFVNDLYQVNVRSWRGACNEEPGEPDIIWLSIKRRDKQPIHDWRDLQQIKNELVGMENEAVEIYPAESRKVDAANQYHLWVFSDPKYRIPWGFQERLVCGSSGRHNKQRPL